MTSLILVRHGQSEANSKDIFTGQGAFPLSALGHAQAERTAKAIADKIKLDKLYSSDLPRAVMTAEHISSLQGIPICQDARLREINAGSWEGQNFEWIRKHYPYEHDMWITDIGNCGCPNGETLEELRARFVPAVEELAEINDGKTICIVSHATALRVLECVWNGFPISRTNEFSWLGNTSITIAKYDIAEHKGSIVERNIINHLEDIL